MVNRLNYLDFLRGIAILLVLLTHTHHLFEIDFFSDWASIGARGVQLFYIVSGFTIYYIYQNKLKTKANVKSYLIKRVFRIFPAYFLILPVYYIFFGIYNDYNYPILNLVSHYFLINGFFPEFINSIMRVEWSIFDEFMFYFVFVFLMYKFKRFSPLGFLILTSILSLIIAAISFFVFRENLEIRTYLYLSPYFQFYNFFIGVYLASVSNFNSLILKSFLKSKLVLLLTVSIFVILPFIIKYSIVETYISSILFASLLMNLKLNNYNYPKIFLKIGEISFSLYLSHNFFIMYYEKYFIHNYVNFSVLLLLIFLFSTFLYYTVEKYGINIGKRLA